MSPGLAITVPHHCVGDKYSVTAWASRSTETHLTNRQSPRGLLGGHVERVSHCRERKLERKRFGLSGMASRMLTVAAHLAADIAETALVLNPAFNRKIGRAHV